MWLACHTQEEIAEAVGTPRKTVADSLHGFGGNGSSAETAKTASDDTDSEITPFKLSKSELAHAEHASDFEPMFYNIGERHEGTSRDFTRRSNHAASRVTIPT